jgi:predicted DNA-binding WGR domain protein
MAINRFKAVMTRQAKEHNIRYYKIELCKTLFNEYQLTREYGNVRFKKPTGIMRMFFDTFKEGEKAFLSILKQKQKRGYCCI